MEGSWLFDAYASDKVLGGCEVSRGLRYGKVGRRLSREAKRVVPILFVRGLSVWGELCSVVLTRNGVVRALWVGEWEVVKVGLGAEVVIKFNVDVLIPLLLFSTALCKLNRAGFTRRAGSSSRIICSVSMKRSARDRARMEVVTGSLLFATAMVLMFATLSVKL